MCTEHDQVDVVVTGIRDDFDKCRAHLRCPDNIQLLPFPARNPCQSFLNRRGDFGIAFLQDCNAFGEHDGGRFDNMEYMYFRTKLTCELTCVVHGPATEFAKVDWCKNLLQSDHRDSPNGLTVVDSRDSFVMQFECRFLQFDRLSQRVSHTARSLTSR